MQLEDWLAKNWNEVREQRGLSWSELAEQCRNAGQDDIAAWADEQAKGDKSARARKGTERAVKSAPEKR